MKGASDTKIVEAKLALARTGNLRMLVDKAGRIVDLLMNDHVQILLGVMLCDLGESEFLGHLWIF
jgi:hypothetical protein